jgi:hypothetical protein
MQTRKTTTKIATEPIITESSATAEAGPGEMQAAHRLEMRIIGNADIREVQSPPDEAERLASGLPNTLSYSKAASRQGLRQAA